MTNPLHFIKKGFTTDIHVSQEHFFQKVYAGSLPLPCSIIINLPTKQIKHKYSPHLFCLPKKVKNAVKTTRHFIYLTLPGNLKLMLQKLPKAIPFVAVRAIYKQLKINNTLSFPVFTEL